jgi:molybdenum cofactor cytidylyltransferase
MKISAILLGAGESKRMGCDKLSLPWGRRTILDHCLQTLLRSKVKEVIVVVNERTERIIRHRSEKKVKVVMNPDYQRGMSCSIRYGIKNLSPESDGMLIALGDQPLLKAQTINVLLEAFEREDSKIIIPSFKGRKGHPVIFPRTYKEKLLRLRGDEGGKSIIMKHPEKVCIVPVKSPGVIRDIDTWEDYRNLTRK